MSVRSRNSVWPALFASVVISFLASGLAPQGLAQTQTPAPSPDERYVLGPDSLPQPGVPAGTISEFTLPDSSTYRGYSHKWWLYVPAGYDRKTPIALLVFQDGGRFVQRDGMWRVPVVLDNLIFRNELPLMAAVFVDPGQAIRPTPISSEQRSYEYDTLSDQYARFLVTEILPEVNKHVRVTDNPVVGESLGPAAVESVPSPLPGNDRISSERSFLRLEVLSISAVAAPIRTSFARARSSHYECSCRTESTMSSAAGSRA